MILWSYAFLIKFQGYYIFLTVMLSIWNENLGLYAWALQDLSRSYPCMLTLIRFLNSITCNFYFEFCHKFSIQNLKSVILWNKAKVLF